MRRLPGDEDAASECRVGKTGTLGEMLEAGVLRDADYEAAFEDSTVADHMRQAAAIVESFDPILYELRTSHSAGTAS